MERIKSRNFILIVCGFFFMIFMFLLVYFGMIRLGDKIDNTYNDVLAVSSKAEIKGEANFEKKSPNVLLNSINNFSVNLKNANDSVKYSVKLCNMNDFNLIVKDILLSGIDCYSASGLDVSNYVRILSDVEYIDGEEIIYPKQCVDFFIYVELLNDYDFDDIIVTIDSSEIFFNKINN